jgi:hypothetical protein
MSRAIRRISIIRLIVSQVLECLNGWYNFWERPTNGQETRAQLNDLFGGGKINKMGNVQRNHTAMGFLRLHWFDVGIALAIVAGGSMLITHPSGLSLLLWLSLISLFLHQFEEYRYPGYFPGIMNSVMLSSEQPDRYPLNTNTALVINLGIGWLFYFLAAVFNEKAVWLGIATILVSVGNFFAHTFLFNIKGRRYYNPGMLTAILLFLPLSVFFFLWVIQNNAASTMDWIFGILLGIALNFIGILKMIDWMKDKNTTYIFPSRFMVPEQQKKDEERN